MPMCCIVKCGASKNENQPQLSLHRFPKNVGLKKKWLEAIGEENINHRHKVWYVCSLHFEKSCFNRTLDVMRLHDNSVPTVFSKTEAQLKKCWENLKTRRKSGRAQEKSKGMKTMAGSINANLPSTSSQYQVMEVSPAEQTDFKLLEVIYSDADDTSTEEMTEVLLDSEVLPDTPQLLLAASESRVQVLNESAIETGSPTTPPHLSEFRLTDYGAPPSQAAPAATHSQIEALINFMSENKELARGQLRNTDGRLRSKRLWEGLCNSLNSMGGCIKSVEQWQRVWADKKHLAKKAAAASRRSKCAGGAPSIATTLSQVELRILSIMGESYGERQTSARVPAFPSGLPVKQEPAAISPTHPAADTPADPLFQEQPSMSPDPLELEMSTQNQQRSKSMRNEETQEEVSIPRRPYDRFQQRNEELHKLNVAEKEWMVKSAEENFYKVKAERVAAEELILCNRAKRKEAELRLAKLRTLN